VILRRAAASDVDSLVDIQQAGAVLALGHIFPQDLHPFPRAAIVRRWLAEIADPGTQVYVFTDDGGSVTGFAATRSEELLHFGTAPATWGSGLASSLHDAVLATFAEAGIGPLIRLHVFDANARARRFYEKHGWRATGRRSRSSFPPYPELLEYHRQLFR
jgi:ribosomal protein S18 acetylase RimI-like enzyme